MATLCTCSPVQCFICLWRLNHYNFPFFFFNFRCLLSYSLTLVLRVGGKDSPVDVSEKNGKLFFIYSQIFSTAYFLRCPMNQEHGTTCLWWTHWFCMLVHRPLPTYTVRAVPPPCPPSLIRLTWTSSKTWLWIWILKVNWQTENKPFNLHHLLLLVSIICNLASLIAFSAWAAFPCAYKVPTFQFPILICVFWCTVCVLGFRVPTRLSLWSDMLCATRPPRFGRLPLMCKTHLVRLNPPGTKSPLA